MHVFAAVRGIPNQSPAYRIDYKVRQCIGDGDAPHVFVGKQALIGCLTYILLAALTPDFTLPNALGHDRVAPRT